jgi:hypothetical protein
MGLPLHDGRMQDNANTSMALRDHVESGREARETAMEERGRTSVQVLRTRTGTSLATIWPRPSSTVERTTLRPR